MVEPQHSSRRSRQPRHSGNTPRNGDEGEFAANQPANFVGSSSVRSIPINPRLQMHSRFFLYYYYDTSTPPDKFLAASLRERDKRAARKAAKKLQKARQTEAGNSQLVDAAAVQPQVAIPNGMMQPRNSQFYSPLSSSASPLFPSADFTNTTQATPGTPVFQGANLTLPPRSLGGWNQNQFVHSESSPPSNELEPWNQLGHQGNQNFTGSCHFY